MKIKPEDYVDTLKSLNDTKEKYKQLHHYLHETAIKINNDSSTYSALATENLTEYLVQPPFNRSAGRIVSHQLTLAVFETRIDNKGHEQHPVLFDMIIRRVPPKKDSKYYHLELSARMLNNGEELGKADFQLYNKLFNDVNDLIKQE